VWKTVRRFDSGFPKDRSIFITVLISKKRVKISCSCKLRFRLSNIMLARIIIGASTSP
jgi:hypothetical protein